MPQPDFATFRQQALDRGCDEVLERSWEPNVVLAEHTHPFDADALVVQGEMWLGIGNASERRLGPGDTFQVPAGQSHHERYGSEGATYWVGRRTPRNG